MAVSTQEPLELVALVALVERGRTELFSRSRGSS
jgi:hypothetical protein